MESRRIWTRLIAVGAAPSSVPATGAGRSAGRAREWRCPRPWRWIRALVATGLLCAAVAVSFQEAAAAPGSLWRVARDGAPLRGGPGPAAPLLARLSAGDRLIEFERQVDWIRVGLLGAVAVEGWVREAVLLPLALDAAPEPLSDPKGPGSLEDLGAEAVVLTRFRLEVGGTPGLDIATDCRVVAPGQVEKAQKKRRFSPFTVIIAALALSCRVRKRDPFGRLHARLFADGVLIAERGTRAAFNHVRLRSDGPWGPAGAIRGTTPRVIFPNLQDDQGPVPHLRGRTVPRFKPGFLTGKGSRWWKNGTHEAPN